MGVGFSYILGYYPIKSIFKNVYPFFIIRSEITIHCYSKLAIFHIKKLTPSSQTVLLTLANYHQMHAVVTVGNVKETTGGSGSVTRHQHRANKRPVAMLASSINFVLKGNPNQILTKKVITGIC